MTEVLDGDALPVSAARLFIVKVGQDFVESILSQGNSAEPMELYRRFMGREPDLQALLERAGLMA